MKKSWIITAVLLAVFWGVVYFITVPNLNPFYSDGLASWAVFITATTAVIWLVFGIGGIRQAANTIKADFKEKKRPKRKLGRKALICIVIVALPWILLFFVSFFTCAFFNSGAYRDQISNIQTEEFSSDIDAVNIDNLPIVDQGLATLLADKMLGTDPTLGSQVTLGTPTIQMVKGKLVWVVPLEHSGFFKWLYNISGTPGYIIVSATNTSDVTYVNNHKIKYQPNAYLLDNLERHARFYGGEFLGLTDYSFEIDDSGRPYWVITTYSNLLGFNLPEASGALIVDAETGDTAHYSIDNLPSWVDRIQPADYLTTQLNNRGTYINGIFNFSNSGKFETSEGYSIIYNNGRCYYFTGLTSVGSDESTIGFIMIDMVTKEAYQYSIAGATEYAAQQSAEGKVQSYGYKASYPLMTNVDGNATYFMTLKDDAGLIKDYAFVSVADYSIVGTGENASDALVSFRRAVRNSGNIDINTAGATLTLDGTVSRFASEDQGGNTVYKFMFSEKPGILFSASYDISDELALTGVGDSVEITYDETSGNVVTVLSFKNKSLGLG